MFKSEEKIEGQAVMMTIAALVAGALYLHTNEAEPEEAAEYGFAFAKHLNNLIGKDGAEEADKGQGELP